MPRFQTKPFLESAKPQVMETNRFRKVMPTVNTTEFTNARSMAEEESVLRYASREKPLGRSVTELLITA